MAAYGEDSSRSALTFMPPVTRQMVSRPLESPRMSAYKARWYFPTTKVQDAERAEKPSGNELNGPEIGDVDEGVVEGGEDAGYAEDIFTWKRESIPSNNFQEPQVLQTFANLRTKGDIFSRRALNLLLRRHIDRRIEG